MVEELAQEDMAGDASVDEEQNGEMCRRAGWFKRLEKVYFL